MRLIIVFFKQRVNCKCTVLTHPLSGDDTIVDVSLIDISIKLKKITHFTIQGFKFIFGRIWKN